MYKRQVNAYFNGNWNYDAVKENLGEENVGVAALPTINIGGKDCQLKAFLGSKAIGVNPNCKNQEVAVKLAAFLGSEDAQLAHFKLRAQAPVNKDLVTNEEIAADPVAAAMAKVSSDCSVAQPIIDMAGYLSLIHILQSPLSRHMTWKNFVLRRLKALCYRQALYQRLHICRYRV